MSTWCRVCHEHDCGIDHRDSIKKPKILRKTRKPTLPEGVGRSKPEKPKPKVSHTQLRLF